ncbi:MAG: stage III sporulation protein AE [Lachnospiraceae bacterium]|nr:stage III sporulation protein AE [Lachnospiraceae bacterium]
MKKTFCFCVLTVLILFLVLSEAQKIRAEDMAQEDAQDYEELLNLYDLTDIDVEIKEKIGNYSFSEIIGALIKGDFSQTLTMLKDTVLSQFFNEVLYNRYALIKIILLAVISAMFSNISIILDRREISETGFFITYLLMITILIGSFQVMSDMLDSVVQDVSSFIKIIIPAMVLSAGLCSGQATALGFGEIALFTIYIGEILVRNVVLPFIKLYVILMAVNNLMDEDYLSKFGGIFKSFVLWFLKFFTGVVMGIQIIKGMILPGIDLAGKNTAIKLLNLIPGAEEINAAGSIFLSSASVIKNAIGGASILILVMIVAVPAVKMFVFVIAYRITAALIQPMADRRISGCVDSVADSVMLLNKVLITQFIMLSLSIAVLCMVTS